MPPSRCMLWANCAYALAGPLKFSLLWAWVWLLAFLFFTHSFASYHQTCIIGYVDVSMVMLLYTHIHTTLIHHTCTCIHTHMNTYKHNWTHRFKYQNYYYWHCTFLFYIHFIPSNMQYKMAVQCEMAVQVYKQQLNALITVVGSFENVCGLHSPNFHILASSGVYIMIFLSKLNTKAVISLGAGRSSLAGPVLAGPLFHSSKKWKLPVCFDQYFKPWQRKSSKCSYNTATRYSALVTTVVSSTGLESCTGMRSRLERGFATSVPKCTRLDLRMSKIPWGHAPTPP